MTWNPAEEDCYPSRLHFLLFFMCSLLNICWHTVHADSLLRLIGTKNVTWAATADFTELQEAIFSDISTPPQLLSRAPPASFLFSLILLLHLPGRPGDVIKGGNKARPPGTHHVCLSPFLCNEKNKNKENVLWSDSSWCSPRLGSSICSRWTHIWQRGTHASIIKPTCSYSLLARFSNSNMHQETSLPYWLLQNNCKHFILPDDDMTRCQKWRAKQLIITKFALATAVN